MQPKQREDFVHNEKLIWMTEDQWCNERVPGLDIT